MKYKAFYFLLIPLLLTGCGNNNNHEQKDDDKEENCLIKEDTSIDFLCMADKVYHSLLLSMIDDFMEKEPHVKVHLNNPLASGNYNALERAVVAGFFKEDYPDIVQCYPDNVVKYISRGYALNLDDFLDNQTYGLVGDEKKDYITSFLEEGQQYSTKGTYSLPFCKSTELMYYNADVLLGLDLSTIDSTINNGQPLTAEYLDNLTWEELFDKLCPAIYAYNEGLDADHKIYVNDTNSAVFTYDSDDNFFITLANQYGYGYTHITEEGKGSIDFENDEMKALTKKLYDARDKGYLETKGAYHDYVSSLFVARKALFTVSSTAGLSYNYNQTDPFSIGVAHIPHAAGKDYSAINQGPSVCILDHKDNNRSLASFLLWKHITNKNNSSIWSLNTGYMGIRNSSYETDDYKAAITVSEGSTKYEIAKAENLKRIADVKEHTFNTSVFKGSGNARTNVGKLLKDILLSNGTDAEINDLFHSYSEDAKKYLE